MASQNKVKVSTDTHTDTKTTEENGVTIKTTTIRTVEKFSDGSTSTTTETHTVRHEDNNAGVKYLGGSNKSKAVINVPPLPANQKGPMKTLGGNIPQTSITTDEKFIQDALFAHNAHRARHGVPSLMINLDLCKFAQQWANTISNKGSMDHSGYGYGENIYWNSGVITDGAVPVEYWYSEVKAFNWDHNDFQKGTGLFTQVVWKNSRELGIAKAQSQKGTFVVALYNPAGNVIGEFPANVLRPIN